MMRTLQAGALAACLTATTAGQDLGAVPDPPAGSPADHSPEKRVEAKPGFSYTPPVVERPLFGNDINMLAQERDQYATNLAAYAAKLVIESNASGESLADCRRILALAMHLSPRNRQALVVNHQLRKGVLPQVKKSDYSASVLSRLLMSRSLLLGQGTKPNEQLLARCFVEMAATLDPRNEDAVFAFEIQRLDHGDLDWDQIMESRRPVPVPAPHDASGEREAP